MPELGVSDFSTVFVRTGKSKLTKIRELSNRPPYAHFKDYYLPLRTAIKGLFIQKRHISYLYEVCRKQTNASKKVKFERIANVFKDWQSGKNISAFKPIKNSYLYSRTDINCNPELNIVLNGQSRFVKLHFSESQKMNQQRANIMCALLEEAIRSKDSEYSVLDLTNGKEFFFDGDYDKTFSRINAEISNLEDHWNN